MKPAGVRLRNCVLLTVARVCGLLLLAACGATAGHSLAGTGPHPGGASAGSGGAAAALYPVAVGNSWTYRENLGALGTYTGVIRMTAVTRSAAGQRVTMTTSISLGGSSPLKATSVLIVHPDGSITVPLSQFQMGGSSPLGKSGAVTWPPTAQLASGRPFAETLDMADPLGGSRLTDHVTIKGDGTVKVTVPSGTYQAIVVDQAESGHFGAAGGGSVDVRTWMAPGVGPVKSVSTITGGGTTIRVSEELLKFHVGST